MFQFVSEGEMEANRFRGKLYRDHFNSWLDGSGLAVTLLQSNGPTPPLQICEANVGDVMGEEYVKQFRSWSQGAVVDLVKKCDTDGQRFTYGSFGSVWLDTTLTGKLVDGTPKAKDVRIALVPTDSPALRAKCEAVRVVNGEARVVKVKKAVGAGLWQLAGGEEVDGRELHPMHKLNDEMQYMAVIDPTVDGEEVF